MNLHLTKSQARELIDTARREMVGELLKTHGEDLRLVSAKEAARLLDVTPKTLSRMPVTRVCLPPTKSVKYRLADIHEFINSNLEK